MNRKPSRWALGAVLLGVGVVSCGKLGLHPGAEDQAKKRVEVVLTAIRDGGTETGLMIQTAICRWERDVALMSRDEVDAALDPFDHWRQQGGIYPTLKSFTIADKVEDAGPHDPGGTFYVQVKIDGNDHWIRVPPKAEMSWAD
jgi:hypothetical protein